ncbi:MAG: class I SAM-dependent methyltransferase [Mycobacteriales bacterium]
MALERIDYDDRQHRVYAKARAMSPEVLRGWLAAFARHADPRRPLAVLDLGSGTGRFTPALADTFGGPVTGVEPSRRMRAVAEESAAHPAVRYLDGSAERIPLPDGSCDLVLMFLSWHHVADRPAAAAEVARVLRPGGRLLLRSTFGDRIPPKLWHRYFPGALAVERELFPTLADTVAVFGAAGFSRVALDTVTERYATSLAGYAERLRLRGISVFEYLAETEIEAGFAALDADVAAETAAGRPRPVEEDLDLLVFAAPGQRSASHG